MAKKLYDAVVVTGKYTNRDGVEKKRYLNVGAVMEGDKGLSLKLEALPVNFDGWINFYEPKAKKASSPVEARAEAVENFEDEIPF